MPVEFFKGQAVTTGSMPVETVFGLAEPQPVLGQALRS